MLVVKGDHEVYELMELLAGREVEGKQFAHLLHEIVATSGQDPDKERFLVVEEAIEGAGGELGPFGNLLEGGLVIAFQPKDILSGV